MRALLPCFSVIALVAPVALAKPMPEATVEDAVAQSSRVVVAEFVAHDPGGEKIDFFSGTRAKWKVVEVLRGPKEPAEFSLHYAFHDQSPCEEPDGWTFEAEKELPKKGERRILFVRGEGTYRGTWGRWEATPEKVAEAKEALAKRKPTPKKTGR